MKDYTCHTSRAHNSQTFTLISKKILIIWKFLFTRNRECKHNEVDPKLHVCNNDLVKMSASYLFQFSQDI